MVRDRSGAASASLAGSTRGRRCPCAKRELATLWSSAPRSSPPATFTCASSAAARDITVASPRTNASTATDPRSTPCSLGRCRGRPQRRRRLASPAWGRTAPPVSGAMRAAGRGARARSPSSCAARRLKRASRALFAVCRTVRALRRRDVKPLRRYIMPRRGDPRGGRAAASCRGVAAFWDLEQRSGSPLSCKRWTIANISASSLFMLIVPTARCRRRHPGAAWTRPTVGRHRVHGQDCCAFTAPVALACPWSTREC